MPGYNLALITEGKKTWKDIAAGIAQSCDNTQTFWEDRLHAIFVRKEDDAELSRRLVQYGINTTLVDATKQEQTSFDLALHLEVSRKASTLIVISVYSIGRALDAMIAASIPVQQLALLGSEADSIAAFVEPWLDVKVLSVGSISSIPVFGKSSYRCICCRLAEFMLIESSLQIVRPRPSFHHPTCSSRSRLSLANY